MNRQIRCSTLLLSTLLIVLTAQPSAALWNIALDEDFDKDQAIAILRWPWATPPQAASPRWHYNPRGAYYRSEGRTTDYSWGLQNLIYNTLVRRNDIRQAIWCAYTNQNDPNNPRWPADDDYMNNQNAWAWWGPYDLRRARDAMVSYCYLVDVTFGSSDSLTICIADSIDEPTLDGAEFRRRLLLGVVEDQQGNQRLSTYPTRNNDWLRNSFSLSNLRGFNAQTGRYTDSVSVVGQNGIFICFVWQSNYQGVTGKGAFIDDVVTAWDDGLFDLNALETWRGHPVAEDSVIWSHKGRVRAGESILHRADFTLRGNGFAPPFAVECLIDGELFQRIEGLELAASDTLIRSVVSEPWIAPRGQHIVRWVLDSSGDIEESSEDNNVVLDTIDVYWNPAPQVELIRPYEGAIEIDYLHRLEVHYAIDDSLETDSLFTAYFYWTTDTTGLAGNIDRFDDYHFLGFSREARRGDNWIDLSMAEAIRRGEIEFLDTLYICGFVTDGEVFNNTIFAVQGRLFETSAPGEPDPLPAEFRIVSLHPNPFNRTTMVIFDLPIPSEVRLEVFDLAGRSVEAGRPVRFAGGRHSLAWQPDGLGAGVYLLRMDAAGRVQWAKGVYVP
ncbi:MAG: hypothetical protein FJY67_03060 [Calditrichaeota bacterium]|nr:hypothetical protein [Calditrichota bacterium]